MKRKYLALLFCNLLIFTFYTAKCQTDTVIQVAGYPNTLQVSFHLPAYEIKDTSLMVPYGISEIFKYIQIDDEFGIIDSVGLPQLPQFTFDLHVPYNAEDFNIEIISAEIMKIGINRKIMPAQEDLFKENPVYNFSMNNRYYNSSGGFCDFHVQYNESFLVFGEQGINLTIFPFIYNPVQDSLTVLLNAVFQITYHISGRGEYANYHTAIKENYLNSLFKNYPFDNTKVLNTERYLMITPPDYESTLTYFANYKRNIGYEVIVVTTNTTGSSADSIKYYIQGQYNNTTTRPTYLLLVGDVDKIPAYEGDESGDDPEKPITDLGYSLLEGDDLLADVFLGRFSVESEVELKNIINKTIFMEMNMHRFEKKSKFWAGKHDHDEPNWIYMESEFRKGHNYVIPYSFEPLGYDCEKIYQPSENIEAVNALGDNPLFYLYSGHGNVPSLDGAYAIYFIEYANNTIFPCFFAFSCLTGNFAKTCIGESLIRASKKGVLAYFGSSAISYTYPNLVIEKKIFGDAFLKDHRKLSPMINTGMRRFTYVAGIDKKVKERHLKAYNLLGDPSLDVKGIGCKQSFVFNYPEIFKQDVDITYRANNLIQNNNSFVVESGATVKLLAGNSVVLKPGFKAETGSNVDIRIVPCADIVIRGFEENNNDEFTDATENITKLKTEELVNSVMVIDEVAHPAIFSVFPNPTSDDFSLAYTLENNSFVQIDLYNMQGVYTKTFLQIVHQEAGIYFYNFSLSGLTSGINFLVFKSNSKTLSSKIIKH